MATPNVRIARRELNPIERAWAHGMSTAGMSACNIAPHFGVHHATIAHVASSYNDKNEYKSAPRDAPRKTTKAEDKALADEARRIAQTRRQPLRELQSNIMPQVSRRTIQRQLAEQNIRKWRAAERPLLEKYYKKLRLEWAKRYRHYSAKDWTVVVWSDEVSVSRTDNKTAT